MTIKLRPFWIRAPRPFVGYIKAAVHPDTLKEAASSGLSVFLGQYLGHIHGKASAGDDNPYPPIAIGAGLMQPKAIFRGVKRMMGRSQSGDDVSCYVTNPDKDYELDTAFAVENAHLPESERLKLIEGKRPKDSVLVTFVLMNTALLDEIRPLVHDSLAEVQAVVIGWEWTLGMPDGTGLPFDHPNRYEDRII